MKSHDHIGHEHHDPTVADDAVIPEERQAICVVTGDVVDKEQARELGCVRDYDGQTHYFCCATCVQMFDKNPEQYTNAHTHLGHENHHHTPTSGILRLKEKQHLVDNIWAFRFVPKEPIQWEAGQFIRIELPHDNSDEEGTKRWFTITSAPYESIVQITTRITQSTFKQALAAMSINEELSLIEKPDGDFVWTDDDKQRFFIAGGIGITPFYSILKQRLHEGEPIPVKLIYSGRDDNLPFKAEFEAWAKVHGEFKLQYQFGEQLTADKIFELSSAAGRSEVYVSGPEPMVEALGGQLLAKGVDETSLHQDFFPNYSQENY